MKLFTVSNTSGRGLLVLAPNKPKAKTIAKLDGLVRRTGTAIVAPEADDDPRLGGRDISTLEPGVVTRQGNWVVVFNPFKGERFRYQIGKDNPLPEVETDPSYEAETETALQPVETIKLTGHKERFDTTRLSKAFVRLGAAAAPTEDEAMQARLWFRRGRRDYVAMAAELIVAREQVVEDLDRPEFDRDQLEAAVLRHGKGAPTLEGLRQGCILYANGHTYAYAAAKLVEQGLTQPILSETTDARTGRVKTVSGTATGRAVIQSGPHPHAQLMGRYADDATETDTPWEQWEERNWDEPTWHPCLTHPTWNALMQYRRKPGAAMTFCTSDGDTIAMTPDRKHLQFFDVNRSVDEPRFTLSVSDFALLEEAVALALTFKEDAS